MDLPNIAAQCFDLQYHDTVREIARLCVQQCEDTCLLAFLRSQDVHDDFCIDEPYVAAACRARILIAAARISCAVFVDEISSYALWLRDQRQDPVYAPFEECTPLEECMHLEECTITPEDPPQTLIDIASRICKMRSVNPLRKTHKFRSAQCVAASELYTTQQHLQHDDDARAYLAGIFPHLPNIARDVTSAYLDEIVKARGDPGDFSRTVLDYECALRDVMDANGQAQAARVMSIGRLTSVALDVQRTRVPGEQARRVTVQSIPECLRTLDECVPHLTMRSHNIQSLYSVQIKRVFDAVDARVTHRASLSVCIHGYLAQHWKALLDARDARVVHPVHYSVSALQVLQQQSADPNLSAECRRYLTMYLHRSSDALAQELSDAIDVITTDGGYGLLPRLVRPSDDATNDRVTINVMDDTALPEVTTQLSVADTLQVVAEVLTSISQQGVSNVRDLSFLVALLRDAHARI